MLRYYIKQIINLFTTSFDNSIGLYVDLCKEILELLSARRVQHKVYKTKQANNWLVSVTNEHQDHGDHKEHDKKLTDFCWFFMKIVPLKVAPSS
jgi:hypothetical protein